ncbi:MAG TPA: hypothetical protein VHV54_12785 [Candidatus Binatia bacterium]|nr:hypothetical protein [Candidatus Binatia bacterium]
MQDLSPGARYTQELINLLQEIVTSFGDADSRPNDKIALYEKYRELQRTHNVKLVGRFIVISGNAKGRARHGVRSNTHARQVKSQLRLAQLPRYQEPSATSAAKA